MFQEYFLKDSAILTTPSAPFRNGFFFFVAQPPLLFKEGNPLLEFGQQRFQRYSPLAKLVGMESCVVRPCYFGRPVKP